jgi:hypothetical protein
MDLFPPPSPPSDAPSDSDDATVLGSPVSPKIPDSPDAPYTLTAFGEIPLSNIYFMPTSNPDHEPASQNVMLLHLRAAKPPMPKRRHRGGARDHHKVRLITEAVNIL